MLLSDFMERVLKGLLGFTSLSQTLGIRRRTGGPKLEPLVPRLEASTGLPAADHVSALIPQDLEEPRAEGAIGVELVERLPRLDEGILERVAGIIRAAEHPDGKTKTGPLIRSHEGLVESDTACFARSDQLSLDLRLQRVSSLLDP